MPRTQAQIDAFNRYKENNYTRLREQQNKAGLAFRWRNIEKIREQDRLRKRPFEVEWRTLRKIDIF
jgi:hypothetical protein